MVPAYQLWVKKLVINRESEELFGWEFMQLQRKCGQMKELSLPKKKVSLCELRLWKCKLKPILLENVALLSKWMLIEMSSCKWWTEVYDCTLVRYSTLTNEFLKLKVLQFQTLYSIIRSISFCPKNSFRFQNFDVLITKELEAMYTSIYKFLMIQI